MTIITIKWGSYKEAHILFLQTQLLNIVVAQRVSTLSDQELLKTTIAYTLFIPLNTDYKHQKEAHFLIKSQHLAALIPPKTFLRIRVYLRHRACFGLTQLHLSRTVEFNKSAATFLLLRQINQLQHEVVCLYGSDKISK